MKNSSHCFKSGEQVICINPDNSGLIVRGEIYTVIDVSDEGVEPAFLRVSKNELRVGGFRIERFISAKQAIIHQILSEI